MHAKNAMGTMAHASSDSFYDSDATLDDQSLANGSQHAQVETYRTVRTAADGNTTMEKYAIRGLSIRGVLAGLLLGFSVSISNIYFGLQIGFTSTMSLNSSLLGFGIFKLLSNHLRLPFTPQENVVVQTVAGAVGCMPATAALIGVIPALEFLLTPNEHGPLHFTYVQLSTWSIALCLPGLVWAMMLRRQFIIEEKLPWPGAVATATMISVLHSNGEASQGRSPYQAYPQQAINNEGHPSPRIPASDGRVPESTSNIRILLVAAVGSGFFVRFLRPL